MNVDAGNGESGRWRRFRKSVSRRLRRGPEWVLVSLGWYVIPRLSRQRVLALARIGGRVGEILDRRSRRTIEANLEFVYGPAASRAERDALVRSVCRHAALVVLDFFWFSRDSRARVLQHVSFDDRIARFLAEDEAAVVVTGHLGTWELAAQLLCAHDRRLTSVYAPLGGALTQRRMEGMRAAIGQTVVPRDGGAAVALLRALHDGHVVGLLLDQHATLSAGGAFVDFLGHPAAISKIAGVLSIRRNVPVHAICCKHTGNGFYRTEMLDTLPPGHGMDELAVTQWVANTLGAAILRTPEQWFWMYRRWRHVPPGVDGTTFPFYSHPFNPACD